ncbi:hypothetical protein DFP72DRAFT_1166894 [Ephemerocybe angulata]|uniref:Uncharacterized protein n=1 Tax=Ephemerocybe angulata TaxID=980116 RepID=A0A8H6M870_9AGAR|nr:hypothetical protein DFP72DRAFT_1166894 [Tulosesus angulatus]
MGLNQNFHAKSSAAWTSLLTKDPPPMFRFFPTSGASLGSPTSTPSFCPTPRPCGFFYDEPPSPTLPLPFSSPFPSSLRVILLTCTDHGVTMKDILLLSAMVPHLERLQVAEFLVDGSLNAVTTGSDILQGLKWLSVGGFQHSPIRINTQDRTPPSRPSASLRSLLDGLSVGSGMPSLRRLDILTDIEIPHRFLDVHGSLITSLSITGAHHECVNSPNTFDRFTSLHQLIILTGPTLSNLPRGGNPSVSRISIIRPPPSVGALPHSVVVSQLDTLIEEVVDIAPKCPSLRHVAFIPPHDWLRTTYLFLTDDDVSTWQDLDNTLSDRDAFPKLKGLRIALSFTTSAPPAHEFKRYVQSGHLAKAQ